MLHGEEDPDLTEIRSSTKDKVDFHDPRAVRYVVASRGQCIAGYLADDDALQTADGVAAETRL